MVPRNSTPGGFAYILQSKWVGTIAIKIERTQIHFFCDVLIAVASLDLKVPLRELKQKRRRRLQKLHLTNEFKPIQTLSTAAGLAQSVERLTAEREVAGSIPGAGLLLRVLRWLRN